MTIISGSTDDRFWTINPEFLATLTGTVDRIALPLLKEGAFSAPKANRAADAFLRLTIGWGSWTGIRYSALTSGFTNPKVIAWHAKGIEHLVKGGYVTIEKPNGDRSYLFPTDKLTRIATRTPLRS